jgi:hypothetical protein
MNKYVSITIGALMLISLLNASISQDIVTLEEYSASREGAQIELGRLGAEEKSSGFSSTL